MKKLPIKGAKEFAEKWGLDQVLVIARCHKTNTVHTVSYGKTKLDSGYAAMDIQKLRRVLECQPTSLEDAVSAAEKVKPSDIEGI